MDTALCSHAHTFLLVASAAAGAKARRQAECAQTLYFQPLLSPTFLQGQQAHLRIQWPHGPGRMVLHVLFLFYVKQLQFARLWASSAFISHFY